MDEEKKKYLYGGSYDTAIRDTYTQMQNRPAFNYDVNGDALYQQYRDRYTQNARNAMKDTMGQAAALTGGYGNSYAQSVGQQRYDETMRGLTDMIPTLEERAYSRWKGQGDDLQARYQMLMNMGAAEQQTQQAAYSRLYSLIAATGYMPSAEELAAAGMTAEQANAMLQWWITNNPDAAYQNGQLSPEDYYRLTGRYPVGYNAAGGGTQYTPQYTKHSIEEIEKELLSGGMSSGKRRAYYNDYLDMINQGAASFTEKDLQDLYNKHHWEW